MEKIQMHSRDWETVGGIVLEQEAVKALRDFDHNVVVTAGPGAGKTEFLAQKACYLLQTELCPSPYRVLAISFKNSSADNLRARVSERCKNNEYRRFDSYTFDAFAKKLVDQFLNILPDKLRPSYNYKIIDDNKRRKDIDKALEQYMKDENTRQWERLWNKLLHPSDGSSSELTFRMIFYLAGSITGNTYVKWAIRATYPYVFVDEFQDTTSAQYNFLKKVFKDTDSRITAVGDVKQRIMLWAGAKQDAFECFEDDYSPNDYILLANYRSTETLVDFQRKFYPLLKQPCPKTGVMGDRNDTNICVLSSRNDDIESDEVAESIKKEINSGIAPENICILTRKKVREYTSKIQKKLDQFNIRSQDAAKLQMLLDDPFTRLVIDLIRLSINPSDPDDIRRNVENELMRICGLPDAREDDKQLEKLELVYSKCISICNEGRSYNSLKVLDKLDTALGGKAVLKKAYPQYEEEGVLESCRKKFIHCFKQELEISENDWSEAIDSLRGIGIVPIMTIHRSKGLEYEYVYLIGLEGNSWWDNKHTEGSILEAMSTFFVAISRAKRGLIITRVGERNGRSSGAGSSQVENMLANFLRKAGYL
ncbi:UvrD-helicase domain-containing protein [Scardovia wiggsiae]|nr:ATP-dependent helicase [Scardovia wiggsiae]